LTHRKASVQMTPKVVNTHLGMNPRKEKKQDGKRSK
jgi:hypothetical protein